MQETLQCDAVVIGAGVIGLAIASRLVQAHGQVILVERHPRFGNETSSRNSEVIHSGIYYPPDSLKTKLCLLGRDLLYDYCASRGVSARRIGKIVVATDAPGEEMLENLAAHARTLGVRVSPLTSSEISLREPLIEARAGLCFPDSGVVDSHELMRALEQDFAERGGIAIYRHRVLALEKSGGQWQVSLESPEGLLRVDADLVVNAAGLAAAAVANAAAGSHRFEHRYCRGKYFHLPPAFQGKFQHLIYPVPEREGLGIHLTLAADGSVRLGPDVEWCDTPAYLEHEPLYDCEWEKARPAFAEALSRYAPSLAGALLAPGLIGIRPKLFVDGTPYRDFLLDAGEGLVNCLGIESPGLTASLALADEIAGSD